MVFNFIPRKPKRTLALILIGIGIFLSLPPLISLIPFDDIVNIWIAKWITERTDISMLNALILTYTVIGWSFILAGIFIFPYNSERLMNGMFHRVQNGIRSYIFKVRTKPINLIYIAIVLYIFYRVYLFYASTITF